VILKVLLPILAKSEVYITYDTLGMYKVLHYQIIILDNSSKLASIILQTFFHNQRVAAFDVSMCPLRNSFSRSLYVSVIRDGRTCNRSVGPRAMDPVTSRNKKINKIQ
jgi:hypothetical protein